MLIMWKSFFCPVSSQKTDCEAVFILVTVRVSDVDEAGMKNKRVFPSNYLSTFYPLFFQLYDEIIHQRFGFNVCLHFVVDFLIRMLHSGMVVLAVYFGNGFIR